MKPDKKCTSAKSLLSNGFARQVGLINLFLFVLLLCRLSYFTLILMSSITNLYDIFKLMQALGVYTEDETNLHKL